MRYVYLPTIQCQLLLGDALQFALRSAVFVASASIVGLAFGLSGGLVLSRSLVGGLDGQAGLLKGSQTIQNENVLGPLPYDPIAMCRRHRSALPTRCHERVGTSAELSSGRHLII